MKPLAAFVFMCRLRCDLCIFVVAVKLIATSFVGGFLGSNESSNKLMIL